MAKASASMPNPIAASVTGRTRRVCIAPGSPRMARPRRTAGSTVANETAPKNAPANAFGETPVYHQFFSLRSTSSKMSQKSTLAAQQAIQSPGVASGDLPRRQRTRPSRLMSTPAHASGKRNKSAPSDNRDAMSVAVITRTPNRISTTRESDHVPVHDVEPEIEQEHEHAQGPKRGAPGPRVARRPVQTRSAPGAADRDPDCLLARIRVGRVTRGVRVGLVHALLVLHRLAHDLDLVGAVRRRIETGAHLLALVDRRDAGRDRLAAADHLGLRVDGQRHAAGRLVEGDAVLVDLGHRARHRPQAGVVRRSRARDAATGGRRVAPVGRAAARHVGRAAHAALRAAGAAAHAALLAAGGSAYAALLAAGRAAHAALL